MELPRIISRYLLIAIYVFLLNLYKPLFSSIIFIKTTTLFLLCLYLDYYIPKYVKVKYYTSSNFDSSSTHIQKDYIGDIFTFNKCSNSLSIKVLFNTLLNYSIFILCLYLTLEKTKYTELCPYS